MPFDLSLLNAISRQLQARKSTVSVAESVTSGNLQAAFSIAPSATRFFEGGLTAYNLGQKYKHLEVEPIYADEVNCVSEAVANKMAATINRLFCSDYGLAITGYTTPVPELNIFSIFAIFTVAHHQDILYSGRITSSKSNTYDIQIDYVNQGLSVFNRLLSASRKV